MSYAREERGLRRHFALVPDTKYMGPITLYGVIFVVASSFIIMLWANSIPYVANATTIFLLMLTVSGVFILLFGLATFYNPRIMRGESITKKNVNFVPVFVVGMISLFIINFMVKAMNGKVFVVFPFTQYPLSLAPSTAIFTFVIIMQAPVCEEFLFSGMFQTSFVALTRRLNLPFFRILYDVTIVALLSFAFMYYHGAVYGTTPSAMIATFLGRMIFAFSYAVTDNLDTPIALHAANNFIAFSSMMIG